MPLTKRRTYRRIPIPKSHKKTIRHYCMDVEGGNLGENARIIRFPCHKGKNQKFHYNKTRQLIAHHSGKCVDNLNGRLYQKTCSSAKSTQKWRKSQKKNTLVSLADRKCVDADIVTDKFGSRHLITTSCSKKG